LAEIIKKESRPAIHKQHKKLKIMNTLKFSLLQNSRTYGIELRERNYPSFEGRYNIYVSVYGPLSGDYLGNIEQPLKMNVVEDELFNPALINEAINLIYNGHKVSIF